MIKINNIEIFNFDGAFRGLRNPMNSWNKSDSYWTNIQEDIYNQKFIPSEYVIGPNDLKLAQRMIKGGPDESKFMRQIFVSMDIDAPLYWWKEMDTYKVATVANSCSTMHKLASTPITNECFSFDNDIPQNDEWQVFKNYVIKDCERLRQQYIKTKNKDYWRALIQILPSAWMQKRTWTANYQVLRNIYFARRNHKLSEWHEFIDKILTFPYAKELISLE